METPEGQFLASLQSSDVYLELIEHFSFRLLTIFTKSSMLDV